MNTIACVPSNRLITVAAQEATPIKDLIMNAMELPAPPLNLLLALLVAAALVYSTSAGAAEPATPAAGKQENCLMLSRIRKTQVVDQNTVLFYFSQNEIYKNTLPHTCNSLRSDTAVEYRSSINELCSTDIITPLVSTGGGYMHAGSCGLGRFERIDKAGAQKLLDAAKAARRSHN